MVTGDPVPFSGSVAGLFFYKCELDITTTLKKLNRQLGKVVDCFGKSLVVRNLRVRML